MFCDLTLVSKLIFILNWMGCTGMVDAGQPVSSGAVRELPVPCGSNAKLRRGGSLLYGIRGPVPRVSGKPTCGISGQKVPSTISNDGSALVDGQRNCDKSLPGNGTVPPPGSPRSDGQESRGSVPQLWKGSAPVSTAALQAAPVQRSAVGTIKEVRPKSSHDSCNGECSVQSDSVSELMLFVRDLSARVRCLEYAVSAFDEEEFEEVQ